MQANGFEYADQCSFFMWRPEEIALWVDWVDDNLVIAPPSILETKEDIIDCHSECDDIGNL